MARFGCLAAFGTHLAFGRVWEASGRLLAGIGGGFTNGRWKMVVRCPVCTEEMSSLRGGSYGEISSAMVRGFDSHGTHRMTWTATVWVCRRCDRYVAVGDSPGDRRPLEDLAPGVYRRELSAEEVRLLDTDAKIGDEPLVATDTGLTCFGKRIFIEGDRSDSERFVKQVMKYYPLIA